MQVLTTNRMRTKVLTTNRMRTKVLTTNRMRTKVLKSPHYEPLFIIGFGLTGSES
ncbi:hypothetical protein [Microcoleus sp. PH2017_35_SFW_U_B]|uniref:hypothetical protein n=1 Tax=Microcoleus sp. PH2017_35_SFW_U_B TaxID=2798845 RepID=UPI001D1DDB15|nr:hypothetical protein [Microcoleus sp. PH2017_35_SFW_U_B]MCC3557292.1 hypothetical protein [Microcoleus sp. PH2017_35_SFW_U_B]